MSDWKHLGLVILAMYIIAAIAACVIGSAMTPKPKTLPSYKIDTTYVDAFHVDSTGKYLINWKGDTCKRKTKLEE